MNKWRYAAALLIVQFLQTAVISRISLFGAGINLSLVFVVCVAIVYGETWGGYTGLGLGLLEDIVFAQVLGVRALLYYLVGLFVGEAMHNTSSNKAAGALAAGLSTIFAVLAKWAIYFLLRQPVTALWYFMGPLFTEAILNGVLYLGVLWFVKRFMKPQTIKKYSGY